jgi:hypothetical protein
MILFQMIFGIIYHVNSLCQYDYKRENRRLVDRASLNKFKGGVNFYQPFRKRQSTVDRAENRLAS